MLYVIRDINNRDIIVIYVSDVMYAHYRHKSL